MVEIFCLRELTICQKQCRVLQSAMQLQNLMLLDTVKETQRKQANRFREDIFDA